MDNHVNANGELLTKTYEGVRLKAYPDPATGGEPWTIGVGHTSSAGLPEVYEGLVITEQEADEIFHRDLAKFADGVNSLIDADINDNQFSALVSFAYNIGLSKFRRSSVLRAVNDGLDNEVPRRLAMYTKAAGRTLPGLVKRRSAEGHLYMTPVAQQLLGVHFASCTQAELDEMCGVDIDEPLGLSGLHSNTNLSAILSGAVTAGLAGMQTIKSYVDDLGLDSTTLLTILGAAVVLGASFYIINSRNKKAADYGI